MSSATSRTLLASKTRPSIPPQALLRMWRKRAYSRPVMKPCIGTSPLTSSGRSETEASLLWNELVLTMLRLNYSLLHSVSALRLSKNMLFLTHAAQCSTVTFLNASLISLVTSKSFLLTRWCNRRSLKILLTFENADSIALNWGE